VQQQQQGRFRRFVQTPAGKALLIALTILVVFASYVYVNTLVAIPAMLLFGLAVPIWGGLKAPRYLALSGLVILLVMAPVSNLVVTQDIFTPIPASTSLTGPPDGNGGAVLQNALVSPYTGGTSTNFTWTVTIYPQFIPKGNSSPLWLTLYISTCPGATSNSSCPGGSPPYPFTELNHTVHSGWNENTTTFVDRIGSGGIWDWQMSVTVRNNSSGDLYDIFLVGDPSYNGIEGPVIGTFASIYAEVLPTLYFDQFLFLGAPFYFVLLLYVIFKRRERGKADAARRAAGPTPEDEKGPSVPSAGKPGGPSTPPSAAPASPQEGSCPSCGAVVYTGEKTCWKCGATLGPGPGGAPLPTSGNP
jgi:hypothetical protein